MIAWFMAFITDTLLTVCGYLLLAWSLQQLLALAPVRTRTPLHYLCWSVFNTLLFLSIPSAALLKLPDSLAGQMASSFTVGSIFTMLTLAPGLLALFLIIGRRWPPLAPVWFSYPRLRSFGVLMFGTLLLMLLMNFALLQWVPGIGAIPFCWAYLYLFKQYQIATPPFQPGLQLNRRYQPAALLMLGLSLFLAVYGSNCLVELCLQVGPEDSALSLPSLLALPLPAQLCALLFMVQYISKGQDSLAGAYLISSLIPLVTLLPAVILFWGGWSLDWPAAAALIIAAGIILLIEYSARNSSGITPLLMLSLAAVYPFYLILWLLIG